MENFYIYWTIGIIIMARTYYKNKEKFNELAENYGSIGPILVLVAVFILTLSWPGALLIKIFRKN